MPRRPTETVLRERERRRRAATVLQANNKILRRTPSSANRGQRRESDNILQRGVETVRSAVHGYIHPRTGGVRGAVTAVVINGRPVGRSRIVT